MPNTLNAASLTLLRSSEACRLTAYLDPRGIPTIGWGHTGPEVHPGLTWTQTQADAAQKSDLAFAEQVVRRHVTVPLSDNQYGALVDFVFNAGAGAFLRSTLLKRVNQDRLADVPAQLKLWVSAGGRRLPGLAARRQAEIALWNTPELPPPVPAEKPGLLGRLSALFGGTA